MGRLHFLKEKKFYVNLLIILLLCVFLLWLTFRLLDKYTRHDKVYTMPDFIGQDYHEVEHQYAHDFHFFLIDSVYPKGQQPGSIYQQDPMPNSKIKKGRNVYIIIVAETPEKTIMPNLHNLSLRQAIGTLESAGLNVERLEYKSSPYKNAILDQYYDGQPIATGTELVKGSKITLHVGRGRDKENVKVPNLIGKPIADAKRLLNLTGLNVGEENFFHADYEATLLDTYGKDYEDTLVVEGGVVANTAQTVVTESKGTITVAASPTPHAEILAQAAKILAGQGWTLEVTEFEDYVQPNLVVESGDIDANYFQHVPYLENFNEEKGTSLVSVAGIHYEPFGIYPGTKADLAALGDGDVIAVPNDTTNEARALLLLQDNGIIKLKDGAGLLATVKDIEENPHNIKIQELEAAQVSRVKDEVAFVVLNGNYALEAGFSVAHDAVAYETSDSVAAQTYVNVLIVKAGNENNEGILALAEVLKSQEIKQYIIDTYDGAVVPFED